MTGELWGIGADDGPSRRRTSIRPYGAECPVRFRWEPGSVAFCGNLATVHLVPGDNARLGSPRITHRVMRSGDVPVEADGRPCEPLTGSAPDAGEAGRR
ncbi:hypothetical protein [Streptomyces sp. NPDC056160]|uniref:hypothetical protein n=1 Tax=Streptomyces sp. NPDC056160 TaxID=3345731 RepID=UPI0035D547BC